MDFVTPVLEILSCLWNCVAQDVDHVRNFHENLKALEDALDLLMNVNADVRTKVELQEERHMMRTKRVDSWMEKVREVEKKAKDVLAKANQESQNRCCHACLKSCWSRFSLGKAVKKLLKVVNELKDQGKFDTVADVLPRGPVDERPLEETVWLNSAFDEVLAWIKDEKVKVIGTYGMGGVGKTTLLTKINNEFVNASYGFDLVIWIVVSKQSNVEKVQESICEKLRLPENTWKTKSMDEKAVEIFRILRMKKFVLMLDDIWNRVDMVKVGIPPPENETMSKVLFTTRFEDVCGRMEADKKVKIECLKREESLTLFRKKVGINTLNAHPSIPKFAEIAVEECKGLPLSLITVGRAMAGKNNPRDWDMAITKLKKNPSQILGMDEEVYNVLRFSYDSLFGEAIKSCFLYCCIYPEDYDILIDDLLELWIGEGLLDEHDDIHEARDQGWEILRELKSASLLENGKSEEYVKMHDVIRDMALWISGTGSSSRYLVLNHARLLEAQTASSWMEAKRISLWGSSIRSIPHTSPCPKALTFLATYTAIRMFPAEILQHMPGIKVLDLSSNFHLTELPLGNGYISGTGIP